jgi:tripartite ATP-independent transporter DctM subunit
MASLLLLSLLVIFVLLGAPIGFVLVLIPTAYIVVTGEVPWTMIPYNMYEALAHPPLIAIPFFMLTGELMTSATITDRLIELSRALVGRARGGLAQVNIVVSMFFAGMNGSVVADTATVGSILIPAMKRAGYSAAFSAAITSVSATIGGIIPPSIGMIILATVASLSVGALFSGGIIPGILIGLSLMAITWVIARKRNYERSDEKLNLKKIWRAFLGCALALSIPIVLVGAIVGGVASPVEAGAITAITAFLLGLFVYRSLDAEILVGAITRAFKTAAAVFIIIAAAGPFSWLLTRLGTLKFVQDFMLSYTDDPFMYAVVLILLILVVGMIMDAAANIIVVGPVLIAVSVQAGYPEVQAALVVVVGFLIGTVTPPIGVAYFTGSSIARAKLEIVAVEMVPFLIAEFLVLFLMMVWSPITMWLPKLFGFVE